METTKTQLKILKSLLKNLAVKLTVTSLAKEAGMSRVGSWKTLKKMETGKFIRLSPIGSGKTSTYVVRLNWDNPLVGKTLSLALTEDAMKNQRWASNFSELENKVDFLVIYGSILLSSKQANDIDLLGIVSNKDRFIEIENAVRKIQKTQIKKIHILNLTPAELKQELKKQNPAFIEAIKEGVILFGQEKFIRFMEAMHKK